MADDRAGDYFISDVDDDLDDDDLFAVPVVVPSEPARPATVPVEAPKQVSATESTASPAATGPAETALPPTPMPQAAETPAAQAAPRSREERLAASLDSLMASNPDIQATALVSLDGFIMASALPEGMQEDRVGAMSAAILGLGERAATELGRGQLTQVYIEGAEGIVVLISAGGRAVLTALASADSRLGLVLYDMRSVAEEIGRILA